MGQARDEAGNIWETDAQGNAERLLQPAASGPQMPADPSFQYEGPKAAADLANTQGGIADRAIDNRRADVSQAAELFAKGLRIGANGQIERIPDWEPPTIATAEQRDALRDRRSRLDQLIGQINRVETLYDSSIGKTKGVRGIQDYFPTDANARFDAAGAALSQQGLAAFRVPGTGTVSDRDAMMFDRANLPTASTRDSAIEEQLLGLRNRVEAEMSALGQPAPQWEGVEENRPNAMTTSRIVGGQGPGAAEFMATTKGEPVNPEYQAEYTAWVRQNAGRFTPEQYAAFRTDLDQRYGYGGTADYVTEGQRIADRIAKGGSLNLDIPPNEQPMSGWEQFRNSAVSNPVGAAAAGFADMGGFGGVSALAGDQMAALGEAQPVGMALGQIGGSIAGTSALGRLGKETLGRMGGVGRTLLDGGKGAQFGRNLATDAAYSGIYGGVADGDPLAGAALGTIGSAGGQGVGKVLGRAIGGLDVSPAVQRLRDAGVRLTTGQTLGGIPRRLEDAFTSMPGVGDIAGARRLEGLQDFNRAAFGEAGSPIGATARNIGEEGVQELLDQASSAYDGATAGVRVPLDPQFQIDMGRARTMGTSLPADLAPRFNTALANRVEPIATAGEMTGDTYQQAFRGLKGYRSETTKPGFEQDYRDALTRAMDALTGQMERGGGGQAVTGLRNADQAYRGAKTLGRAVQAAKNGAGSGEIQTFTPAQLNTAATQAANKYGGGRQMADLIDAGQSTLPSTVPDSGTGRRLATMALPAALGGTAAGVGGYTGGGEGAQTGALSGLALAALLMAGGTRGGQSALNTVLTGRGPRAQIIGRLIRKRSGLFGSASLPLALEAGS